MTLKRTANYFSSAIVLCTMLFTNVCGQKIVTGHLIAEVIESVNSSSYMVTDFSLENKQQIADSVQQVKVYRNSKSLNLGTFTINPGEHMACNIKMNEAILSDNKGNYFTIVPTTLTSGNPDTLRADGVQTLSLNGIASLTSGLDSGYYKGLFILNVILN